LGVIFYATANRGADRAFEPQLFENNFCEKHKWVTLSIAKQVVS